MSEMKFACPVCGQHITADPATSGTQLECPTCFRKLVVPRASTPGDTKLVVTAAEVGKPREALPAFKPASGPIRTRDGSPLAAIGLVVVIAGAVGAGLYFFRDKIFGGESRQSGTASREGHAGGRLTAGGRLIYPSPTNFSWTMDMTNTPIPETAAAGSIRGRGFYSERATLTAGALTLRQGHGWPPELGVRVVMFAKRAEDLSGKTVEIWTNRAGPVPQVFLHWKDDDQRAGSQIYTNGYAMKIVFGAAANGRMPGRLYLCLPDEARSFIGGVFDAEIRKPQQPQPRPSAASTPRP